MMVYIAKFGGHWNTPITGSVEIGSSVKSVQAYLPNRAPALLHNGGGIEQKNEKEAVREPCQI